MGRTSTIEQIYETVAIEDEGRACRDIPDSACREEPRNFLAHVGALALSKSADGLIDPKLVLSWLMTALGAPAFLLGLLVPVREAGALLPQLFTAGAIRRLPQRKFVWAAGAFVQGLCAVGIGVSALLLEGAQAGWMIVGFLALLAVARSACSVSYKDVLGKTVSKSRRGKATGLAGTLSAAAIILFGLLLTFDIGDRFSLVVGALFLAGGLWLSGAVLFLSLQEQAGATEGGKAAFSAAMENISLLREDAQLRLFILVRGLLTGTALAPPFMLAVAASGGGEQDYAVLGYLLLASALASLLSSYVWGRLADRSSRKVLLFTGVVGAAALGGAAVAGYAGWLTNSLLLAGFLFVLMIAYQGVRLGRSTHLVDMATEETRATYTALSNTVIGIVLLAGGLFGVLAAFAGSATVLAVMAAMSALAALAGMGLKEVQAE
ncbi:MFS transporter [Parvularcula sp. IMCC14364]|uniref:MFS transporter n=1 Tax=Parvularcula sp. IMCC14364 TaxID=3067902 RepID=UPI002740842B|nr:MFS transporter [Parvularcula sp. IMCC14364]